MAYKTFADNELLMAADLNGLQQYYDSRVFPMTFTSGWDNYAPGTYANVAAIKHSKDVVSLVGMFKRSGATIAAGTGNQGIGLLPVEVRPATTVLAIGKGYSGTAYTDLRFDIFADGNVRVAWLSSAPWTQNTAWGTFFGITYQAAV